MSQQPHGVQFRDLQFTYSGETLPVFTDLNCSFPKHKLNLLLGPSGCGKSTAMYLLGGIIPHAIEGDIQGSIYLDGEDIAGKRPQELAGRVGFVFQDPESQFCTFTVADEIAFGLENINTPVSQISRRIVDSLAMVGFAGSENLIINNLSGGEKQKIAIAAVLAMEPETIILDEPTANLDPASTDEIFGLLEKLVREQGKTLIVIEHKLDGFLDKVDHIVVMDQNGQARLQGGVDRVLPRLLFDSKFDSLKVFLPEHLLIVRDVYVQHADSAAVRDLRRRKLDAVGGGNLNKYGFDLDFGVKALTTTAAAVGMKQVSVDKDNSRTANPLVVLDGVSFAYQKARVSKLFGGSAEKPVCQDILHDLDLTINEGDFAAILGPNGAGKSTLLNLIFQIETAYRGKISISGKDVKSLSRQKLYQDIGLVFQNPEWQFVTNDVEQELLYSLKKSVLSDRLKSLRVEEMLGSFHLENEKGQSPFLLSQGQKRRLSVAAMLLAGQKILFLDEPTYGQDYQNQLELMELMKSLNQNGVTIVLVTHDMSLVADYAHTVHLLCDGKIRFSGLAEDLFADDDLIKEGRLMRPVTWEFSRRLAENFPGFPQLIGRQKIINAFNETA